MPRSLVSHEMITIGNDVFVLGGYISAYQSKIMRLTCLDGNCIWTELKQQLNFARRDFSAFLIPPELAVCTWPSLNEYWLKYSIFLKYRNSYNSFNNLSNFSNKTVYYKNYVSYYKSFFKNILLYMNGRMSKIRSVHTYGVR